MPKVIKKRIPKKTIDTEADVKDKITGLKDTLMERQQTVVKYGIAVLIVLVAVVGFFIYSYTSQKKAKALEYEAYKIYYSTGGFLLRIRRTSTKKLLIRFRRHMIQKRHLFLFFISEPVILNSANMMMQSGYLKISRRDMPEMRRFCRLCMKRWQWCI